MKYKYYLGVGGIFLVILTLILWPTTADLDRLQEMYERGQHEAVCSQLERELKAKPDWHEARELLVKSAIQAGRVDIAVVHLAELRSAGSYIEIMTGQLDLRIGDNAPAPVFPDAAMETVRTIVEDNPDWAWVNSFYLGLLVKLERAEDISGALELMLMAKVQIFTAKIWQAWDMVALNADCAELWKVSTLLDGVTYHSWRERALLEILDMEMLTSLQEEFPGDPILAAGLAQHLQGREGLDYLKQWEQDYRISGNGYGYYSNAKASLLYQAESIGREDLNLVALNHILQVAIESIHEPEKCQILLGWLEERNTFLDYAAVVREASSERKPAMTILSPLLSPSERNQSLFREEGSQSNLSPDGSCLGVFTMEGTRIINLDNDSDVLLPGINSYVYWFWAANSKMAAVFKDGPIIIFNNKGEIVDQIELASEYYYPAGWQGNDILWIQPLSGRSIMVDFKEGEVQTSRYREVFPGSSGDLAWWGDQGEIVYQRGEEIVKLPQFLNFISWFPDGSGMLLKGDNRFQLWVDTQPKDLGIKGTFLGWRNDEEFYWLKSLGDDVQAGMLMGFNIRTGKITDYDMLGYWRAAAGKTVLGQGYGTVIYRLP